MRRADGAPEEPGVVERRLQRLDGLLHGLLCLRGDLTIHLGLRPAAGQLVRCANIGLCLDEPGGALPHPSSLRREAPTLSLNRTSTSPAFAARSKGRSEVQPFWTASRNSSGLVRNKRRFLSSGIGKLGFEANSISKILRLGSICPSPKPPRTSKRQMSRLCLGCVN